ncbi:hypothetical protein Tco_0128593 [Tanacetum coccineum]
MSPGNVAREGIPFELFRSTYPGRHVARERYPQRQVHGYRNLFAGTIANVVVTLSSASACFHRLSRIIREVFVKLLLDSFGKLSIRVGVRTYLLGGAIDGSEANGIIRDPKLELVGFTPRRRIGFRMELVQGATPICEGSCRLTSLERQEVWNDCRSYKVRVGSNGNLLWEASVLPWIEKKGCVMDTLKFTAMPFGLTNAPAVFMELMSRVREDVREVFQQRGSGAKRKLSRCGRNQMGNEPILALPEGADDFVVYYDVRSKDLEAWLGKTALMYETAERIYTDYECLQHTLNRKDFEHEAKMNGWMLLVSLNYEASTIWEKAKMLLLCRG